MRRFDSDPERDFKVEFTPKAWRQIGFLPQDAFQRIQEALKGVANRAVGAPVPLEGEQGPFWLGLDEWLVLYDLNDERRVLTVYEFTSTEATE